MVFLLVLIALGVQLRACFVLLIWGYCSCICGMVEAFGGQVVDILREFDAFARGQIVPICSYAPLWRWHVEAARQIVARRHHALARRLYLGGADLADHQISTICSYSNYWARFYWLIGQQFSLGLQALKNQASGLLCPVSFGPCLANSRAQRNCASITIFYSKLLENRAGAQQIWRRCANRLGWRYADQHV